jgi:hypothetical protein
MIFAALNHTEKITAEEGSNNTKIAMADADIKTARIRFRGSSETHTATQPLGIEALAS